MEYSNNFYDGFRAGLEFARRQSDKHNNKTEKLGAWHPCHITGIGRCSNCGYIHSMNPVGVENMRRIIQKNGWREIRSLEVI